MKRRIAILGLSITSSWGNGHATTYRGLVREMVRRGHEVVFIERDAPWYAENRDMPTPPFGELVLYRSLAELAELDPIRDADFVIVGSNVPQGVEVGSWVLSHATCPVAFYDIDTPVTLAKLSRGDYEYLSPGLIGRYDAYLSFTGGPTLARLEHEYGSPMARALYCSVDPELYFPEPADRRWDLGYMGTYSEDRQRPLERLMLSPAAAWPEGDFVVAGPQYPASISWPTNVERIEHLPPHEHRAFYNAQCFTLNVTRADMVKAGWSPSVRLFEAAACGVPVISDAWEGLDEFFRLGSEILVSFGPEDTLRILQETSEPERHALADRARHRVLAHHTSAHRAAELDGIMEDLLARHPLVQVL